MLYGIYLRSTNKKEKIDARNLDNNRLCGESKRLNGF